MQNRESLVSIIAEHLGTDTDCALEAGVLFDHLRETGQITFDERDGYALAYDVSILDAYEDLLSELRAEMLACIGEPESHDERQDAMRGWLSTKRGQMLATLEG